MSIQYSGGININVTFTGDKRNSMMSNVLTQLVAAGMTNQNLVAGQGKGNVATFTVTIASPGVVTMATHGFLGNERVILQTTGALPTGLSVNTVYFVKFIDANTFNLSTTSGGSNINTSGSQSGTHTLNTESILIQTAATTQTLAVNFRFKDNLGSCVTISLESTDGLKVGTNDTTHGIFVLPATSETWRIIACKFQFFLIGPNSQTVNRKFAAGGVPYIPSPIAVPTYAGWLVGDCLTDTSATTNDSWRKALAINQGTLPNFQLMFRTTLWENDNAQQNNNNSTSGLQLIIPQGLVVARSGGSALGSGQPQLYRWDSDDIIASDTLLAWGLTTFGDEPKIRCQMFDAIIIHDSFTIDVTTSFDSHNWQNMTNSSIGSATYVRGSMFIVIP